MELKALNNRVSGRLTKLSVHGIFVVLLIPGMLISQEFDLAGFIESSHLTKPDTMIARLAFDALASEINMEMESGMAWIASNFKKTSDGRLKIYQFIGEGCGAYCNPVYRNVLAYSGTSHSSYRFVEEELEFNYDIDSIIPFFEQGLYLVFGTHSGRPRGVESVWGQSVILCSIDPALKTLWKFSVSTSSLVEREPALVELFYHPSEQVISYIYDWYDEEMDFKVYRVSGKWVFNGTGFEQGDEKFEYLAH